MDSPSPLTVNSRNLRGLSLCLLSPPLASLASTYFMNDPLPELLHSFQRQRIPRRALCLRRGPKRISQLFELEPFISKVKIFASREMRIGSFKAPPSSLLALLDEFTKGPSINNVRNIFSILAFIILWVTLIAKKRVAQVWRILFLLLLTTSA